MESTCDLRKLAFSATVTILEVRNCSASSTSKSLPL